MKDISGEILCVSQFTLFANVNKGSKVGKQNTSSFGLVMDGLPLTQPDFHGSAPPDIARPLYSQFVETMRQAYEPGRVKDGVFGAMMQVGSVNDGPVTFDFDTAKSGNVTAQKQKDDKKKKWKEKKAAGKKAEGNQKSGSETPVATEAKADGDGNSSFAESTENPKIDGQSQSGTPH